MTNPLPADIRQVQQMALVNPEIEGLFKAFLTLLENVPDSSLVKEALDPFEPNTHLSSELRDRVIRIVNDVGDEALQSKWDGSANNTSPPRSNVVSLTDISHRDAKTPALAQTLTFDHIGGLENVKAQVRRKIINPFLNKGLFQKFKRKAGGGVLMYGPPGCGKTMFARAVANECNARFVDVRAADILDQYVGLAEKRIAQLFAEARSARPCILFFDEIEALAQRRQFDSISRVNTTVSALLTEMDGFAGDTEDILFLGATNVPWSLDSAFRRPGRFDRTVFVPPPDKIARQFILRGLLHDRPVDTRLDISFIIEKTSGFSGADLSSVVDTAVDFAIEESTSADDLVALSKGHFQESLKEIRSSTGEWLAQARNYSEYANKDGLYDDLRDFLKKYGA